MTKFLVFGDHNATMSTYGFKCERESSPGIPINDISLQNMVKFADRRADILFWCNSYPLMGAEALIDEPKYLTLPIAERWIPYHKFPNKKGFYAREFWRSLDENQLKTLFQNYVDMVKYIYDFISDKLILLPISCYLFDQKLSLKPKALSYLNLYPFKKVDLSVLDTVSNEEAFTETNCLTEYAWELVKPKVMEWVD